MINKITVLWSVILFSIISSRRWRLMLLTVFISVMALFISGVMSSAARLTVTTAMSVLLSMRRSPVPWSVRWTRPGAIFHMSFVAIPVWITLSGTVMSLRRLRWPTFFFVLAISISMSIGFFMSMVSMAVISTALMVWAAVFGRTFSILFVSVVLSIMRSFLWFLLVLRRTN